VQPQTGTHPTSALQGASNIVIQKVCPGRNTSHFGSAVDSVTFAAILDAMKHRGGAQVSRFPADVCAHPYAPGLDDAATTALLNAGGSLATSRGDSEPHVAREPAVRSWVKRRVR
jgi:hypothetical protein